MTGTWVVLGCVALLLGVGVSPLASTMVGDPQGPAAQAMRRAERQFALTVLGLCCLGLLSIWAVAGAVTSRWPLVLVAGLTLFAAYPGLVVSWLLIPLGAVRPAYWLSRLGGSTWTCDPGGGAVLCGVLAGMSRGTLSQSDAAWLRRRLEGEPLRGAGVVALALVHGAVGQRQRAREILEGTDEIEPDIFPTAARTVALDWWVADAAMRGAWHEIIEWTSDMPRVSPTSLFVAACARRIGGQEVPRRTLLAKWLRAPRRRHTLGLLGMAWHTCPERPEALGGDELAAVAANGAVAPIDTALSLHVEAARSTPAQPVPWPIVRRLARVWDRVFEDVTVRGQVRRRADELGVPICGELVVARLLRDVGADLIALASRCDDPQRSRAEGSHCLRRARELHESALCETLAGDCEALRQQRLANRLPVDVWLQWTQLRHRYAFGVACLTRGQRARAYRLVEQELRLTAAWLWHDRAERGLGHGLFLFLLREAEWVADADAAAYYRHNVAVGL